MCHVHPPLGKTQNCTRGQLQRSNGFCALISVDPIRHQAVIAAAIFARGQRQVQIIAAKIPVEGLLCLLSPTYISRHFISSGASIDRCMGRSEERRVGTECVSTCRTRWWPST